ncbi:MAG: class I SAM-dependent methyltransferase, partial [Pseudomonadota bacterium]|nr:class I SAM-dependent methyltransferase [Pseudomonadota bacterium]
HLLRPEGRLLAMKGAFPADEIASLPEGWAVQSTQALDVPGLQAERHLVIVGRTP